MIVGRYGELLTLQHCAGADPSSGFADCRTISAEYLRRCGLKDAADDIDRIASEGGVRLEWPEVPSLAHLRVGDVILSEPGPDEPLHLAVVVSKVPLRMISSARGRGAYVVSPYHAQNVIAMYRPPR